MEFSHAAQQRTYFKVSLFHTATILVLVAFEGQSPERLDWQSQIAVMFGDTSGLSVRDPEEGSFEGHARRLSGGSKTRGRCRRRCTR